MTTLFINLDGLIYEPVKPPRPPLFPPNLDGPPNLFVGLKPPLREGVVLPLNEGAPLKEGLLAENDPLLDGGLLLFLYIFMAFFSAIATLILFQTI
jgi:hypothetical protein